ncbi:CubicO group peptidase (beta-lactamase class C family) [Pedobacter sp. W3I1]|uniref:serine hydrolase domain-containing protein n=1 Tax=Pedobacter sp. W3I1 TaxID=3042291 RepID=UPI00277D7CAF|nr:serine hydrolase domain-containing protein [Pedobacter sp. W3I1]MDQ0639127.1 CubicO group peptidase (beta-lactamase class C family) [Pedobacter sp. W3I1]
MTPLKSLFFFVIVFCSLTVKSQNYQDSVRLKLQDYLDQNNIPGFSVAILNRDKIVFESGFGYANVAKKQTYTPQTIQNIGSVSKTFIAVSLMKAIEQGYFDLETDINTILPFKVVNPYFPDEVIKVKHLTTHTSGILDDQEIYNRSYRFEGPKVQNEPLMKIMKENHYTADLNDTTLITFLKAYLTPQGALYKKENFSNSKPGKRASYSNIGSALAAYLIEVKSGMSFADFTQQYIFKPLHMKNTNWFKSKQNAEKQAVPYLTKDIALPFYHLTTYPDGGLRTSVVELSLYVQEMMKMLNNNAGLIKSASAIEMFKPVFTPQSVPENMSLQTRNKGVFWNIYNDGYIGHDGDDPGASANILFNKTTGIIFMSNIYIADRSKILSILKKYAPLLAASPK